MKFLASLLALPLALAAPALHHRDEAPAIPGRWIAVVNKDVASMTSVLGKVVTHLGGEPDKVWDFGGFRGFTFGAEDGLAGTLLATVSELAFIEQDSVCIHEMIV